MKKILLISILTIMNLYAEDFLLYKCLDNLSYVYYQKSNSTHYNGWYVVQNLQCLDIYQIKSRCNNGQLFAIFQEKEYQINQVNCNDEKIDYPKPYYPQFQQYNIFIGQK